MMMADVAEKREERVGRGDLRRTTFTALLRADEAAAFLGVSIGTLYNLSSERRIPVVKIGRRIRFRLAALEQYAARHERKAVAR